ncbi:L-aspartate oxidase [Leifsonia sp. A12D58]|uniref:L-aspartate oxidase n=1 Tax=Leifsonia sp. A12D58 TaxID=3397674 RepID=UPI0039E007E4
MSSVLIVGSGLAGLFAAVRATDAGHHVALVTKGALPESNTNAAQGGIAAALFRDDSIARHAADTMRAGAGLCDADTVNILCTEGPARVLDLIRFGVQFDRDESGLTRGLEAAHSKWRVLHSGGDATGAAVVGALVATARRRAMRTPPASEKPQPGLTILEHTMLVDLVVGDHPSGIAHVTGALLQDRTGTRTVAADAVILATGGLGSLYLHTTNPELATGDGVAVAWRAGASVADLEFVQFHPTALAAPGTPLISEAVRGEGAVLRNTAGTRFMVPMHSDAELAPRDVVARAIAAQMKLQGGAPVLLDATSLGTSLLTSRFPTLTATCAAAGLDWTRVAVPVAPAAHYSMGGVLTDDRGRTSVAGLFAIGEVARTGVHGANRLASNSLLEAAVFADRAVRALDEPVVATNPPVAARADAGVSTDVAFGAGDGVHSDTFTRAALQTLMWDCVGVERTESGLRHAQDVLASWATSTSATPPSSDWLRGLEDNNLLLVARLIVRAALARTESRGAHFRADAPAANPALAHSLVWAPGHSTAAPLQRATPLHTTPHSAEEAFVC